MTDDEEKYSKAYDEVVKEAKQVFLEKSRKYNYSFFKNDLLTAWFDVRRKYDRIDNLIRNNYCSNKLPSEVIKAIVEESKDLTNYAIMFRLYLKLGGDGSGIKKQEI